MRYSEFVTAKNSAPFCLPSPRRGEEEFTADAAERLGLHIKAAEQALMAAKAEALRPFDLTVAQYATLLALYYVPGQSSAQLARTAAVTPQTMGGIIDKLAAKELIERTRSKVHRKVLVTTLTPAGEKLLLDADNAARAVEEKLGEIFTEAERKKLRTLLNRATEALRSGLATQ